MKNAVIVPAYEADWCLAECIKSISEQTVRPGQVLIGVDACRESLQTALDLKAEHDAKDGRCKGVLDIRVLWFPQHSYPYRIRNTLATLAQADVLHFFDADDLMYPQHIEMMSKALTKERFRVAYAHMVEPGKPQRTWPNALGVISIYRQVFIEHGGYAPWRCAADSEAIERWVAAGLERTRTKMPTMLVRKHERGLTMAPATGYVSDIRNAYRDEIKRCMVDGFDPRGILTAPYCETSPKVEFRTIIPAAFEDEISAPALPPEADEPEEDPFEAALEKAYAALRHMMTVHGRGFDPLQRQAYDMAQEALQ